jgi:pentatricopeptide repeat domain-containing protein 1
LSAFFSGGGAARPFATGNYDSDLPLTGPSRQTVKEVLDEMQLPGCSPERAASLVDVLHLSEQKPLKQGSVAIACFKAAHSPQAIVKVVALLLSFPEYKPNIIVLNNAITQLQDCEGFAEAVTVYQMVKNARFQVDIEGTALAPDAYTYSTVLKACERGGMFEEGWSVYEDMKGSSGMIDTVPYNNMLHFCMKCGRPGAAEEVVFRDMETIGVPPDVQTFNLLIAACGRTKQWKGALRLFQEMRARGIQARPDVYASLISAVRKSGRANEALDVFQQMKKEGDVTPTDGTYEAAMLACENKSSMRGAFDLFEEMKLAGVTPTTFTYNTLIKTCKNAQRADRAMAVFEEMQEASVAADIFTYNLLINACREGGGRQHLEDAFGLASRMTKAGVPMDDYTYSALMAVCASVGDVDAAFRVKEGMEEAGIPLGIVTYNTLIRTCEKVLEVELAFEVFDEMKDVAVHHPRGWIDAYTYSTMIAVCAKCSRPDDAMGLYREMEINGIKPSDVTYNALMSALDIEQAMEIFDDMKRSGTPPDAYTYSTLISVCGKGGGSYRDAKRLFAEMEANSVEPNEVVYGALIVALEGQDSNGDDGTAVEMAAMFKRAVGEGFFTKAARFSKKGEIDLHDVNVPVAWQAVLHALAELACLPKRKRCQELVIITGYGRHRDDGDSFLQQVILEKLLGSSHAALGAIVHKANPGRLVIPAGNFQKWYKDRRLLSTPAPTPAPTPTPPLTVTTATTNEGHGGQDPPAASVGFVSTRTHRVAGGGVGRSLSDLIGTIRLHPALGSAAVIFQSV